MGVAQDTGNHGQGVLSATCERARETGDGAMTDETKCSEVCPMCGSEKQPCGAYACGSMMDLFEIGKFAQSNKCLIAQRDRQIVELTERVANLQCQIDMSTEPCVID